MSKFDRLKKAAVNSEPRKFTVSFMDEAVTLHCLVAGEANKPYWNEVLRTINTRSAGQNSTTATTKTTRRNRVRDAEVFAKHCIVGWDTDKDDPTQNPLLDDSGNVVPFSAEEAEEFLLAICEHAPYAFDELRVWLANERNFTGPAGDGGVELGK